jgi:hypothetical protein
LLQTAFKAFLISPVSEATSDNACKAVASIKKKNIFFSADEMSMAFGGRPRPSNLVIHCICTPKYPMTAENKVYPKPFNMNSPECTSTYQVYVNAFLPRLFVHDPSVVHNNVDISKVLFGFLEEL